MGFLEGSTLNAMTWRVLLLTSLKVLLSWRVVSIGMARWRLYERY